MPARDATDEEPKPGWDVGEEIAVRVVVWQKAALKSTRNKHPLGEVLRWLKTSPPRKRSRLRRRTRSRSERSCWRGSRRSRQAQAAVKASRAASQRRRSLLRSPTTARDTPAPAFNSPAVTARSEPRYRPSLAAGLRLSRGRAVGYLDVGRGVVLDQILIVLSSLALTIRFPSGLNLTLRTGSECP